MTDPLTPARLAEIRDLLCQERIGDAISKIKEIEQEMHRKEIGDIEAQMRRQGYDEGYP